MIKLAFRVWCFRNGLKVHFYMEDAILLVKIDQIFGYSLDLYKIQMPGLKWFNLTGMRVNQPYAADRESVHCEYWCITFALCVAFCGTIGVLCACFYLCVLSSALLLCAGTISIASRSQVQHQPLWCLSVWRMCVVCRVSCRRYVTGHCLWKFQEPDDCFRTAGCEIVVQIWSQVFEWK